METMKTPASLSSAATLAGQADALEERMMDELPPVPNTSVLYTSGALDPTGPAQRPPVQPGQHMLMAADPRLKPLPDKPSLMDFLNLRMRAGGVNHMLQSANLALKSGNNEKVVLACLLHDIAVAGFISSDHGYWAAQMIEPYVDAEVAWAVRAHQALRFFPDEAAGYTYPEMYVRLFGEHYQPEPYLVAEYQRFREHKWYMTGRLITINDLYAFDPNAVVNLEDFTDIIGRNFRQPEEGLGFDTSPSAHMWRTMNWPTRYL